MARQFPQPGEVVALRVSDQGSAGERGVALVARRDAPTQSEATDLSNVVPFARLRRRGAAVPFPLSSVTADERPAPLTLKIGVVRGIALVVASLALHAALVAMFWQQPRPMVSIGVEAMNVEIVLGGNTAAGVAQTPSEAEAAPASPSGERAENEPQTEQSHVATAMPQEVPVAAQETAPEVKPQETPAKDQTVDPKPQERPPETAVAETPAETQPVERTEPPRPQVQAVQQAPERKRLEAPTDKKAVQKKERAATRQTDSAAGVGVGRSERSSNYDGVVRAHIVRFQRSSSGPRDGRATVQFLIDGRGHVTSARIVSSSGVAAYDQEAVAMARRASPFPPPPDGKGRDYTVPVRFNAQ